MNPRQGGVLVLALIVVLVVGLMATSFMSLNASATRRQAMAVDNKLSFYVAEAGIAESFASLVAGQSGEIGTQIEPALFGDGLVWVEPTTLGDQYVQLESHGMCGRGTAYLSVIAQHGVVDPARLGIYTNQDLVLPAGTSVDAYDSSEEAGGGAGGAWSGAVPHQEPEEPSVLAKVGSNGSVTVTSSTGHPTTIVGDITYGPSGAQNLFGSPDIQGTVSQSSAVLSFPPIEFPDIVGETHLVHGGGTPFVVDPGTFAYQDVTVRADSTLVLTGPLSLVVDSLSLAPAASLVIDEREGPVELFVRNEVTFDPRSLIEQSGKDTLNFQLLVEGAGVSRLEASGALHGMIYVPNGTLQLTSALECHGSIVADSLVLGAGSSLHYDAALVERASLAALPRLVSWRLVELAEIDAPPGSDVFSAMNFDRDVLPSIDAATEDPPLSMEYFDDAGFAQSYTGTWRAFGAWNTVRKATLVEKNGTPMNDAHLMRFNEWIHERRMQGQLAAIDVSTNVPVESIDPVDYNLGN